MKTNQVAAQLYTLRDFLKTPEDIATSLKKVRQIGYEAVQISGMAPISEEELIKILDGEGLTCCATHEPSNTILETPEKVVERLQALGCRYTAYPYPAGIKMSDEQQVRDLAAGLESAGAVLRAAGQVLTYHNHSMELFRLGDRTALDIIYDETSPENLQGELDTYWLQYGGANHVDWCRKLNGRLPLIHLKDYKITEDDKPIYAEIGAGNLNFDKIIGVAEDAGCQWFIVEQDTCPGDPFDSLQQSFEYISANLVS